MSNNKIQTYGWFWEEDPDNPFDGDAEWEERSMWDFLNGLIPYYAQVHVLEMIVRFSVSQDFDYCEECDEIVFQSWVNHVHEYDFLRDADGDIICKDCWTEKLNSFRKIRCSIQTH